jgi:Holliday junction resolvase RusA-like endonuclease
MEERMMPYPLVVESEHFPPSLNNMFANVAKVGRVKSKRYKTWIAAAGWDANGKGTCSGPFKLVLTLSTHHRRSNADLDNRIKPVLDLLVTHGIIDGDEKCEAIHASWGNVLGKAFRAEIWPVRP